MEQNHVKLSNRLETLTTWIPKGSVLADIGSDHAYLPAYAVQNGMVSKAIAGEVNQGPYESALETVKALDLQSLIDVRKGDGLEVLLKGEADTIVIAGMGGSLIRSILDKDRDRLAYETTLILQPNNGEETLRQWLFNQGWTIQQEKILEEDGHIYEAMQAQKANQTISYSAEDVMFGPFLRQEKNLVFVKKWTRELERWKTIYEGILRTSPEKSSENHQRLEAIQIRINRMEEVIG